MADPVKGVTFHKNRGDYQAHVRINGHLINVGNGTVEECNAARKAGMRVKKYLKQEVDKQLNLL